eukprot:TRINITY_DN318_c0_g1_i1.p1 TRINITY_DN318_c0_g1~~TRINITY_DN318_c0_g1_i1.p1  ORF type:complete len:127 (-),score=22.35 TRINITY_DN318_c0_g1_i1:113-493(-)
MTKLRLLFFALVCVLLCLPFDCEGRKKRKVGDEERIRKSNAMGSGFEHAGEVAAKAAWRMSRVGGPRARFLGAASVVGRLVGGVSHLGMNHAIDRNRPPPRAYQPRIFSVRPARLNYQPRASSSWW